MSEQQNNSVAPVAPQRQVQQPIRAGYLGYSLDDPEYISLVRIAKMWKERQREIDWMKQIPKSE